MAHSKHQAVRKTVALKTAALVALVTASSVMTTVPAFAAHPLVTEDTGTQGPGNFEIENGAGRLRTAGSSFFAYQPQLSYGLAPAADLIVQTSWLDVRTRTTARTSDGTTDATTDATTTRGFGDTAFDAKWRFYGADPLSLGVRAGLIVATGQRGLGMPHGDVAPHVNLVATVDAAPFAFFGNVEYTQVPADTGTRPQRLRVSTAVLWTSPHERLILTGEAGVETGSEPGRHDRIGSVLAGAIYTIRPGLDADVGYQTTIGARTPASQWLFGLTWRFAP